MLPNWIDIPNGAIGENKAGSQMERIVKDGSTLWATLNNNTDFYLYTSTDNGTTWTNTGFVVGNGGGGFSSPAFNSSSAKAFVADGFIYVFAVTSGAKGWWTYKDLSNADPFSDWEEIGGQFSDQLLAFPVLAAGKRPDGTFIIVHCTVNADVVAAVRIVKRSGGVWSELTVINGGSGTGNFVALQNGLFDSSNGDCIFFVEKTTTPLGTPPTDLLAYRLNAADDSLDGPFTVKSNVEPGFVDRNVSSCAISGTSLAVAWIEGMQNGDPNGYFDLHVGFASTSDLSSWTDTVACSEGTYCWPTGDGQTVQVEVTFIGAVPWIYYSTPYNAAFSPYPNWNLRRASYSSGWSATEQYYSPADPDPVLDPLRPTHNGLDTLANFQLVTGYTTGVGIMVDVEDWFAGYIAPIQSGNVYFANSGGGPYCPVT